LGIRIFNTLSKKKEIFKPVKTNQVGIYVCGVTVYDDCHLGHARAAVVFDIVRRYFEFSGYDVNFICNFTDVDDKIISRAARLDVSISELTNKYIKQFYEDMDALGVKRANQSPRATDHIEQMVEMISVLIDKGLAYSSDGDVYFDVAKFEGYGKLSNRNIEELETGHRIEPGKNKRNSLDFSLWKSSKDGEPYWKSPWGSGRPGWHIECSAMSSKYLGESFDIHGGGEDLVFPHHENEIAQSEGCFENNWVNYWMHNGFVRINHEKMSKSKGNFFTLKKIYETFHPELVRFFILGTHYRNPIDFSYEVMSDASKGLDRLYNLLLKLNTTSNEKNEDLFSLVEKYTKDFGELFREAMNDDFNTARALGYFFDYSKKINAILNNEKKIVSEDAALLVKEQFRIVGEVLGLFSHKPDEWFKLRKNVDLSADEDRGLTPEEIERLIEVRNQARNDKDYELADKIRDELGDSGILVEDSSDGTIWKIIR